MIVMSEREEKNLFRGCVREVSFGFGLRVEKLTVQVGSPALGCRRKKSSQCLGPQKDIIIPWDRLAVAEMLKLSPLATMAELYDCSHHEQTIWVVMPVARATAKVMDAHGFHEM